MSATALAVAAGFSFAAGVCASADGALLSLDVSDERLLPHLRSLVGERERTHRALAFARVAAHLAHRGGTPQHRPAQRLVGKGGLLEVDPRGNPSRARRPDDGLTGVLPARGLGSESGRLARL